MIDTLRAETLKAWSATAFDAATAEMAWTDRTGSEVDRIDEIGELDSTWAAYGPQKHFRGEVIGIPSQNLIRQYEVATGP
jgi:hypothetical protein